MFMFIFSVAVQIIFIALIIHLIRKSRAKKANASISNQKIARLNQEILTELDKETPDYERVKLLRSEMDKEKAASEPQASPLAASNIDALPFAIPEIDGLSVALYIGSLLVLAGVGGLVFSGEKTNGLILLIMMALVFYVGGILLRKNDKLKMASYVFVGTGMMIIPFIGLLIHDITKTSPELIWLFLSLIGVPVYIFATYIMQSRVFAYFSILGFVSLSCSMVATIGLPMLWYFVAVMVLGILFNLLNMLGLLKNNTAFAESIKVSGNWLPLATFLASLTVMYSLSEQEYMIMLSIVLVQLGLNLWKEPIIWRENIFRLLFNVWFVVLVHLIVPDLKAIGLALSISALLQTMYSFYRTSRDTSFTLWRTESESTWIIVSIVCLTIAGPMIGHNSSIEMWGWSFAAAVASSIIFCLARLMSERDEWYAGLVLEATFLPIAILNMLKVDAGRVSVFYTTLYLIEMLGLETLFWSLKSKDADILTSLAIAFLGVAACSVKPDQFITTLVLMAAAIGFATRGILKKRNYMQEAAIYLLVASISSFAMQFVPDIPFSFVSIIIAHLAMGGLVASSLLWEERNSRSRMLFGNIILLSVVGIVALVDAKVPWAMFLFLIEAVATLAYGLALKLKPIWMLGAGSVFLAVLWFTKDLPFVFPVILGLGIIAVVIIALLRRNP